MQTPLHIVGKLNSLHIWALLFLSAAGLVYFIFSDHSQYKSLSNKIEQLSLEFEDFKYQSANIQRQLLKQIITNEQLPTQTRIDAYDEYVKLGGNSWVHSYYDKVLKPLNHKILDYRLSGDGRG